MGALEGEAVGEAEGVGVGKCVGDTEGVFVGEEVGFRVGLGVGIAAVGSCVGDLVAQHGSQPPSLCRHAVPCWSLRQQKAHLPVLSFLQKWQDAQMPVLHTSHKSLTGSFDGAGVGARVAFRVGFRVGAVGMR